MNKIRVNGIIEEKFWLPFILAWYGSKLSTWLEFSLIVHMSCKTHVAIAWCSTIPQGSIVKLVSFLFSFLLLVGCGSGQTTEQGVIAPHFHETTMHLPASS